MKSRDDCFKNTCWFIWSVFIFSVVVAVFTWIRWLVRSFGSEISLLFSILSRSRARSLSHTHTHTHTCTTDKGIVHHTIFLTLFFQLSVFHRSLLLPSDIVAALFFICYSNALTYECSKSVRARVCMRVCVCTCRRLWKCFNLICVFGWWCWRLLVLNCSASVAHALQYVWFATEWIRVPKYLCIGIFSLMQRQISIVTILWTHTYGHTRTHSHNGLTLCVNRLRWRWQIMSTTAHYFFSVCHLVWMMSLLCHRIWCPQMCQRVNGYRRNKERNVRQKWWWGEEASCDLFKIGNLCVTYTSR